ncbi:hypothetical protein BD410DRAFT_788591 [Rickenella mellea]|uniref:Uncharacterized protein n=1 Tax=Rickenella mellea TaxID=50990 RepID=A0A4Y7Q555_9AGAM|nr:hypothetical protein BD410DRAFT_788591 [Rickenella mellea]
MDTLKQLVSGIQPTNQSGAEIIYSFTTQSIVPAEHLDGKSPPLFFLCYNVRCILHPDLSLNHTPHLLDLLAQIEGFRQKCVNQIEKALQWDQEQGDSGDGLSHVERKSLNRLLLKHKKESKWRNLYRFISLSLCRLHIHGLWSSEDSSHTLPKVIQTYFPSMVFAGAPRRREKERLFLRDLTEAESEQVTMAGAASKQFFKNVGAWEASRRDFWSQTGLPESLFYAETEFLSYKREFNARFPPPADETQLVAAIERYLSAVEEIYASLEDGDVAEQKLPRRSVGVQMKVEDV